MLLSSSPYEEWGLSGRPITDFISDERIKFILNCWHRVQSEATNLKDWEPALVSDVEKMFG